MNLQGHFAELVDKKILIYGSGVWCKRVLAALDGKASVVGILDRDKTEGDIQGVPILRWEDIKKGTADAIIVASRPQFYKEIFRRIAPDCLRLGLDMYTADGLPMEEYLLPKSRGDAIENAIYFSKTKDELLAKIKGYDAVSFDIFDTLIMRKVLEPADIFDIVDKRLREKGVIIENFRQRRMAVEPRLWPVSPHGTIDDIYALLQSELHLDDATTTLAKETELRCELDNLVPRAAMVQVLEECLRLGKRVCLVSDMYYPAQTLADMLRTLGITGYEKIYVSCDYKTGKSERLFAEYKKDVGDAKCLHIGDNRTADVAAPKKYGIDSYEIWSACTMLERSTLGGLLLYACSRTDRLLLGHFIASVLNDPFALHDYPGAVMVRTVEQFCYLLAPLVIIYMDRLYDVLDKGDFDTVLFSARDCYLFKRIYDAGLLRFSRKEVPCVYLLASRQLVLKASFTDMANLVEYAEFVSKTGRAAHLAASLKKMFGERIVRQEDGKMQIGMDALKAEAKRTKENYAAYLKKNDIEITDKCLFCDLTSSGTVQNALNKLFDINIGGYYLGAARVRQLDVSVVCNGWAESQLSFFLEKILTAPVPTVVNMDADGNPLYGADDRDDKELHELGNIHDSILKIITTLEDYMTNEAGISENFALQMAKQYSNIVIKNNDLNNMFEKCLLDDLGIDPGSKMIPLHFAEEASSS